MYHCFGNQGSVGTTLMLLFVRLFAVCCSNQRTWGGGSVVSARWARPHVVPSQLGVVLVRLHPTAVHELGRVGAATVSPAAPLYLRLPAQAQVPAPVPA